MPSVSVMWSAWLTSSGIQGDARHWCSARPRAPCPGVCGRHCGTSQRAPGQRDGGCALVRAARGRAWRWRRQQGRRPYPWCASFLPDRLVRRCRPVSHPTPGSPQPLAVGERVMLTDRKHRRYVVVLEDGAQWHSHGGAIEHDDADRAARGHRGTNDQEHGGDGLPPHPHRLHDEDGAWCPGRLSQGPGDDPVGVRHSPGHGRRRGGRGLRVRSPWPCSTRSGPTGSVTSFERRADHLEVAERNVIDWFGARPANWTLRHGDAVVGIGGLQVHRIVLDMLEPWLVVPEAVTALSPGGILTAYMPTVTQVMRFDQACIARAGCSSSAPRPRRWCAGGTSTTSRSGRTTAWWRTRPSSPPLAAQPTRRPVARVRSDPSRAHHRVRGHHGPSPKAPSVDEGPVGPATGSTALTHAVPDQAATRQSIAATGFVYSQPGRPRGTIRREADPGSDEEACMAAASDDRRPDIDSTTTAADVPVVAPDEFESGRGGTRTAASPHRRGSRGHRDLRRHRRRVPRPRP